MNVNRTELVRQLSTKYGYKKESAESLIDDFCNVIVENLELGNTVSIYGFGVFDILLCKERRYVKPVTGEPGITPARWIPRFYPGSRMQIAVKKCKDNADRGI